MTRSFWSSWQLLTICCPWWLCDPSSIALRHPKDFKVCLSIRGREIEMGAISRLWNLPEKWHFNCWYHFSIPPLDSFPPGHLNKCPQGFSKLGPMTTLKLCDGVALHRLRDTAVSTFTFSLESSWRLNYQVQFIWLFYYGTTFNFCIPFGAGLPSGCWTNTTSECFFNPVHDPQINPKRNFANASQMARDGWSATVANGTTVLSAGICLKTLSSQWDATCSGPNVPKSECRNTLATKDTMSVVP